MAARTSPPGFFGTFWRMLVVGTVMFALCGAAGYATVWKLVKTPETEAPDLLAMDVAEAVRKASELGFSMRIGSTEANGVLEPGEIVSQRPLPGDWVKEGATIIVTLAE